MPIYNSDENNALSSLEETYRNMLQEISAYQPPPQMPAPAPIQQKAQQPESRKAPTVSTARTKRYFDAKNLANRLGMKAAGDQASTIRDHSRGTITRINDNIPLNLDIHPGDKDRRQSTGRDNYAGPTMGSNHSYRSANSIGDAPEASGEYSVRPIEKDPEGRMFSPNPGWGKRANQLSPQEKAVYDNYASASLESGLEKGGPSAPRRGGRSQDGKLSSFNKGDGYSDATSRQEPVDIDKARMDSLYSRIDSLEAEYNNATPEERAKMMPNALNDLRDLARKGLRDASYYLPPGAIAGGGAAAGLGSLGAVGALMRKKRKK